MHTTNSPLIYNIEVYKINLSIFQLFELTLVLQKTRQQKKYLKSDVSSKPYITSHLQAIKLNNTRDRLEAAQKVSHLQKEIQRISIQIRLKQNLIAAPLQEWKLDLLKFRSQFNGRVFRICPSFVSRHKAIS